MSSCCWSGANAANDDSYRIQGGCRIDWDASSIDQIMLQGDAYSGSRSQGVNPDENIFGQDMLLRWNRSLRSDAQLQVQTYYDRYVRKTEQGRGRFTLDTFDLDVQHSFGLETAHKIVLGGGARVSRYDIVGSAGL